MTEFIFALDNAKQISIQIPDVQEKFNYCFEPTEKLNVCDQVTIFFITLYEKKELTKEMLGDIITNFYLQLIKVIENKLILPHNIKPGQVGYAERITHEFTIKNDLLRYSLWSSNNIGSFMYNYNKKIYLEITSSYPWAYKKISKNGIFFNEFLHHYQPFFVTEIDQKTALAWKRKCYTIIKKMDALFLIKDTNDNGPLIYADNNIIQELKN